jgi:hypothetical protein
MIVVRTVFQASFGKGGELAAAMKASADRFEAELGSGRRWRLMTDLSGAFDTVVQEVEAENLADWEQLRARMFQSEAFREAMTVASQIVVSGHNELWTIEAQS